LPDPNRSHLNRPGELQPRFFRVVDHELIEAFDQRVFEPLGDRPAAPFLGLFVGDRIGAPEPLGKCDQPLGGVRVAVEDHILASLAQLRVDGVIHVELAGIDDAHVHACRDRVVEEHAVHCAAHRLVAAEAEAQVGQAARNMDVRAARFDRARRLDEVDRIVVVLLDPRRDREDVGIEDDILRRKADAGQQLVGALADFDLARLRVRLANLVERHHDDGGAIGHHLARLLQERLLAFLHADRIDDRLARHALQAGFDHRPFGRVDHHRHARDVGLRADQLQEGRHGVLGIEQALVHVDVDDLGAVLNLLARDLDGLGIVARHDQLFKRRRSGDVGALADVDEHGGLRSRFGLVFVSGGHKVVQAAMRIGSRPARKVWRFVPGMARGVLPATAFAIARM
jgi:hypothetical protein